MKGFRRATVGYVILVSREVCLLQAMNMVVASSLSPYRLPSEQLCLVPCLSLAVAGPCKS